MCVCELIHLYIFVVHCKLLCKLINFASGFSRLCKLLLHKQIVQSDVNLCKTNDTETCRFYLPDHPTKGRCDTRSFYVESSYAYLRCRSLPWVSSTKSRAHIYHKIRRYRNVVNKKLRTLEYRLERFPFKVSPNDVRQGNDRQATSVRITFLTFIEGLGGTLHTLLFSLSISLPLSHTHPHIHAQQHRHIHVYTYRYREIDKDIENMKVNYI